MEELSVGNPKLHEYYAANTVLIDLSHIESEEEFELLRNIVISKVNHARMGGKEFNHGFIQPFKYTIARYTNTELISYFEKQHQSRKRTLHIIAAYALKYIKETNIAGQMMHEHIIYLKNVPIAQERKGPDKIKTFNFKNIKDPFNQAMAEKWILSLLMETSYSVTTIALYLYSVIYILNRYDKNCRQWTDDDVRTCFNDILSRPVINPVKQHMIAAVTNFFTFLAENHYILSSSAWTIANETKFKKTIYYKKTAPSEFVVSQLFNAIKDADDYVKISFLLLYSTGMRISELQAMKKDCLDIRENATFIKYYQTKMRKEVSNVIPPALAELIQNYIDSHPENSKYLFENPYGQIISRSTVYHRLVSFFKNCNIKNEDGTPYRFRSHSFRHLMAVRMHRYKIPYRFIQEQLHHDNPEMTLYYIEHLDEERIKKMTDWINSKGQMMTPEQLTFDIRKAQVETAVLPNGLCTRPASLPSCQHCNTCLGCSYFTTSKEWLPTLKSQEQRLKGFITSAEKQGWDKAVANSQRTLEQLKNIIMKLEVT